MERESRFFQTDGEEGLRSLRENIAPRRSSYFQSRIRSVIEYPPYHGLLLLDVVFAGKDSCAIILFLAEFTKEEFEQES